MQERIPEQVRGEVNGVQNGINSAMDTLKFALVIGLPYNETFGYMTITSVSAIFTGAVFYTLYALSSSAKLNDGNQNETRAGVEHQSFSD